MEKLRESNVGLKMLFNMVNVKAAVDDLETAYKTTGSIPRLFLQTFNSTSSVHLLDQPKLIRLEFERDTAVYSITITYQLNKIDDNLEVFQSKAMSTLISPDSNCLIKYYGPKLFIYDHMKRTYCPISTDSLRSPVVKYHFQCRNQLDFNTIFKRI